MHDLVPRLRMTQECSVSAGSNVTGTACSMPYHDGPTEPAFGAPTTDRREGDPVVSVVIPCYRQAEFLPEAVESVLTQTYGDWELIIVDDGSPDGTRSVAQRLVEQHGDRIRVVAQDNLGVAEARNAGIRLAHGRFILPLDADDRILPAMIEQTAEVLRSHPQVAVAYVHTRQFGDRSYVNRLTRLGPPVLGEVNYLPYCSLFRRELWEEIGGYFSFEPGSGGYEDWDFWLSTIERGHRIELVDEVLFEHRIHAGGRYDLSRRNDRELRSQLRQRHPTLYTRRHRVVAQLALARSYPGGTMGGAMLRIPGLRRAVRAVRRRFGRGQSPA